MNKPSKLFCLLLISISFICAATEEKQDFTNLAEQLDVLSIDNNFMLLGLEHTEAHPAKRSRGTPQQQLKQLLSDFNYMMTESIEGAIQQINITGQKQPKRPGLTIDTERHGNHHLVKGTISGSNPDSIEVSFLIDTGADYVALPESMLEQLGIPAKSLQPISLQTANGKISGKLGQLKSIQIGNEMLKNIKAAFLPDKSLNGTKLLGMNVLGRYQITLNDSEQTMTLTPSP